VPFRRSFRIAIAVFACCAAWPLDATAQAPPSHATTRLPATTGPATAQPVTLDQSVMRPMVFYEAHGQANACGDGCSEWIAADGKIELDTAEHLRHLLGQLNGARPPIFFHSPGGSVRGSMELGRLIRTHKLTVSVGHTMPLNCSRDSASEGRCIEQGSGHPQVEAALDFLATMCNSACVYSFAGGTVRLIPPWVSLGIHDISLNPKIRVSAFIDELARRESSIELHSYLHQMGINAELLTEAFAIPHTTLGRLSRDDAARFGLDRREFGESAWQYFEKPAPGIRKYFFLRTADQPHYIKGFMNLGCATGVDGFYVSTYGRERLPTDPSSPSTQPPINIALKEKQFPFYLQTNSKFYVRAAKLASAPLDEVADDTNIALPALDFGGQQGPAAGIALTTVGFSAAYAKLKGACAETKSTAQFVALTMPGSSFASVTKQTPSGVLPPLWPAQLKPGTKRAVVDAALGAPNKTLGTISLYSYTASDNERKVMAGYFDKSGSLQRFARYVLKDGKVIDEIGSAELTEGQELAAIRFLLTNPNPGIIGVATPSATSASHR
jgi:hypothetical protein